MKLLTNRWGVFVWTNNWNDHAETHSKVSVCRYHCAVYGGNVHAEAHSKLSVCSYECAVDARDNHAEVQSELSV